jgi:glycosyltransferase involved in cell wall biosynthesis
MKSQVSVAVATFNEENNIADFIESSKKIAQEIVVVDGNSTDRTADLAASLGAKVVSTSNKAMFHINKNLAFENCSNEWVLYLDADERISEELAGEIRQITKNNPTENGFWINRRNWFLGGYLKKGGAYPDSVIRLFRKEKGVLPEKSVHEQVKIEGKVGHLKNDILHLADPTFARYLERADRYTALTAANLEKSKTAKNPIQVLNFMVFKPAITFLDIYIRHKGYQDGFRGFVWALFSSFHHFLAYSKYWTVEK